MPPARLAVWLATLAGFALAIKSIAYEPPALWVAGLSLFLYVNLVTFGVVFARFSMFADVVTLGPKNARGVALTFDDGPDPATTPRILDLLDAAGAKATFFVIGRKADEHPEIVRDIVARGHALGMHSYAHDRLMSLRSPWFIKRDLEHAMKALEAITGERPVLFRPPIGHMSPSMGRVIKALDVITIGWSVRALDGVAGGSSDEVVQRVSPRLDDAAIVLMHDASERGDFEPASLGALPEIFSEAGRRNLSFVRVDSWLGVGSAEQQRSAHEAA